MTIFQSEVDSINAEIERLFKIKSTIDSRLAMYARAITKSQHETIEFVKEHERECILIAEDNVDYDAIDDILLQYSAAHGINLAMTGMADCYTVDVDAVNEYNCFSSKNVFLYSPGETYKSNYALPATTYATCTFKGFVWRTPEILPLMLEEIIAHGYDTSGDPIEMCIIDESESDDEDEYVTRLDIPVDTCPPGADSPLAKEMLSRTRATIEKICSHHAISTS